MKNFVNRFCTKRAARRASLALALLATSFPATTARGEAIGDLPGYGEDTYFAADAAYDESSYAESSYAGEQYDNEQAPAPQSGVQTAAIGSGYADTGVAAVGFVDNLRSMAGGSSRGGSMGSCDEYSYDMGGCDGTTGYEMEGYDMGGYPMQACDTMCGGGETLCQGNTWASIESLLWFVQDRSVAPLAIEFDDNTIDANEARLSAVSNFTSGLAPGFRADVGTWLTDNVGVGGRYTQIFDGSTSVNFGANNSLNQAANGTAIPFIDPDNGGSLFLVNAVTGAGPISTGSIDIEEEIDFWMAEAYGRVRFAGAKHHSLDLLGGYTHMELDNSLSLDVNRVARDNAIQALGTRTLLSDRFDTDNVFNGGQIGFEAVMTRGRWMARSLTKVHLGNMNQRVSRRGTGTETVPGFAATNLGGGIFGRDPGESIERDVFAFIPEANFKLGYALTKRAHLTAGYTFMYLDNVALASSAVNPIVSPPGAPAQNGPALGFNDSNVLSIAQDSLFIHGVDVGLNFDF